MPINNPSSHISQFLEKIIDCKMFLRAHKTFGPSSCVSFWSAKLSLFETRFSISLFFLLCPSPGNFRNTWKRTGKGRFLHEAMCLLY